MALVAVAVVVVARGIFEEFVVVGEKQVDIQL